MSNYTEIKYLRTNITCAQDVGSLCYVLSGKVLSTILLHERCET